MSTSAKWIYVVFLIQVFHIQCFIKCELSSSVLENYVYNTSDAHLINYELLNVEEFDNLKTYKLNITTLQWMDEKFSSRTFWWHILLINVPKSLSSATKAILYIDSGDNINPNLTLNNYVSKISEKFNCITATLGQNPNMPIKFFRDSDGTQKNETEIIAWTLGYYLKHYNDKNNDFILNDVPILMPMTKAIVRTMDIIQYFTALHNIKVPKQFVLAGISKRAWSTWLASAVDNKRVVGLISIVYDMLNISASFHTQCKSYGGAFSFEFEAFFKKQITSRFDTIEFNELLKLIDPIYFLNRLNSTKVLVVVATGDEFMMPQNIQNFWSQLYNQTKGNCYLRRIPNTDHFLENHYMHVMNAAGNFIANIFHPYLYKLPLIKWNSANNYSHASIELEITKLYLMKSLKLIVYEAKTLNKKFRDFRMYRYDPHTLNPIPQDIYWSNKTIIEHVNLKLFKSDFRYKYSIKRENEDKYWTAFFIEIIMYNRLDFSNARPIIFSTETNIVPENFPVDDCFNSKKFGTPF